MSLTERLRNSSGAFAVYGAQVVAYGAYLAIRRLTGKVPECFIVSSPEGNPAEIDGIPVRSLDAVAKDRLILVCVSSLLQEEICTSLREKGYNNVLILTDHEEFLLMSEYFAFLGRFPVLDPGMKHPPADLALYEVSNHRDKPLQHHPKLKPFEHAVQAGATLTDKRISPLQDNIGENISAKNKQYCEMSAAYWVWKNTRSGWKGIEHYRRHLLIRPEQLGGGIDAVLPLPYLAYPNILAQFRRFVSQNVLDALLLALKTLHPEEYDAYLDILNGQAQYTYNLVCAKEEVFSDYCAWFFEITEYMETLTGIAPEIGTTRALSYVAEVLTNLYFMSRQDTLRIHHAEKEIYT